VRRRDHLARVCHTNHHLVDTAHPGRIIRSLDDVADEPEPPTNENTGGELSPQKLELLSAVQHGSSELYDKTNNDPDHDHFPVPKDRCIRSHEPST
jgi:hypothetical protein